MLTSPLVVPNRFASPPSAADPDPDYEPRLATLTAAIQEGLAASNAGRIVKLRTVDEIDALMAKLSREAREEFSLRD